MTVKIGEVWRSHGNSAEDLQAVTTELMRQTEQQEGGNEQLVKLAENAMLHDAGNQERNQQLMDDIQAALQRYAPPFAYFGAHPDDQRSYGYWPDWESILDLPGYPAGVVGTTQGWAREEDAQGETIALFHNGKEQVDLLSYRRR